VKYQKKPVVVDAWPIETLLRDHAETGILPEVVAVARLKQDLVFHGDLLVVKTIEGNMSGGPESMLIRGIQGEFYPCRRDIFDDSYELVQ
jgi:hypothetical protein